MKKWKLLHDDIGFVALAPLKGDGQIEEDGWINGDAIAEYVNILEVKIYDLGINIENYIKFCEIFAASSKPVDA